MAHDGVTEPSRMRTAVRPGTAASIAVLLLLGASYVINAADRQVFPVLLKHINADLGFSLTQGGLLSTIFTLGIGIGGIPAGRLLDRYSRKSVMLVGIVIYSAFTVLTAVSVGVGDMAFYRTASGIGEALQNAALFSAVGAYFYARRSVALGVLNSAYGLGGFLGPLIGAHLLTSTGDWRPPFYLFGGIGFLFVIIIMLAVHKVFTERQEESPVHTQTDSEHVAPASLLNRESVLICLACMAAGLSLYSYLGLYPTFLQDQLNFTANQAGFASGLFGIGSLVASIPAGYLGDRFGNRAMVIVALAGAMVVGALMFMVVRGPTAQAALSFLEGAFGSGFVYVNLYSAIQRSVRPSHVGRASGAFVAFFYLPSSVAGYLFAKLVGDVSWAGAAGIQLVVIPFLGIVVMSLLRRTRRPNSGTGDTIAVPGTVA